MKRGNAFLYQMNRVVMRCIYWVVLVALLATSCIEKSKWSSLEGTAWKSLLISNVGFNNCASFQTIISSEKVVKDVFLECNNSFMRKQIIAIDSVLSNHYSLPLQQCNYMIRAYKTAVSDRIFYKIYLFRPKQQGLSYITMTKLEDDRLITEIDGSVIFSMKDDVEYIKSRLTKGSFFKQRRQDEALDAFAYFLYIENGELQYGINSESSHNVYVSYHSDDFFPETLGFYNKYLGAILNH